MPDEKIDITPLQGKKGEVIDEHTKKLIMLARSFDTTREKLVCSYPGCDEIPRWKCDKQKSFLRNTKFERVWQGCNKLVCEKHIVKLFNNGSISKLSKHGLMTLFYPFERYKPKPIP